jgi:MFS transporter, OFA family, oxalate/formate antiporter
MAHPALPRQLTARLPFYYGWVVLGAVCCAGFVRQGPAVSTLSIFVEPMTGEFGWSRTVLSGAVSIGGLLAALAAPVLGPALDRYGARMVLCLAVLGTGIATALLSLTQSVLVFYLLFCFARLNWAGPFDLGIYGALNSWFVTRRAFANSIASLAQMVGLVSMPVIAGLAMADHGWRAGWLAIGATVLTIGLLPTWLLLVSRPEDIGLVPDRSATHGSAALTATAQVEPRFTRAQALRTRAFWLLTLYTMLVYPVQAGMSLHQAAHLIERGIDPIVAATIVSSFSLMSTVSTLVCAFLPRRLSLRYPLALSGALLAASALVMPSVATAQAGYFAAGLFGLGIGGLLTLLPLAWADYFGSASYGAIRGLALTGQVLAPAAGPLLSGALRDATGNYAWSLHCFAALALLSVLVALAAYPPRKSLVQRS